MQKINLKKFFSYYQIDKTARVTNLKVCFIYRTTQLLILYYIIGFDN